MWQSPLFGRLLTTHFVGDSITLTLPKMLFLPDSLNVQSFNRRLKSTTHSMSFAVSQLLVNMIPSKYVFI
jgi:hypothetical protein